MARELRAQDIAPKENPQNLGLNTLEKKKEKLKLNLKYERDKDRTKVRGKFIFHEVPGGVMEFSFKKYKEDELENFKLYDGEIYELPLGVAKHLNQNLSYPIHQYYSQEGGTHAMKVGQTVRRASFARLDFMVEDEAEDTRSHLVTAERVPQQLAL